ncbi:MAG: HGGxSTG domain-containing protein, partial [Hyphomicrobium sp.]
MRLYTITCNARTRAGHPCKRKALANGRCPNHGGLSTGP